MTGVQTCALPICIDTGAAGIGITCGHVGRVAVDRARRLDIADHRRNCVRGDGRLPTVHLVEGLVVYAAAETVSRIADEVAVQVRTTLGGCVVVIPVVSTHARQVESIADATGDISGYAVAGEVVVIDGHVACRKKIDAVMEPVDGQVLDDDVVLDGQRHTAGVAAGSIDGLVAAIQGDAVAVDDNTVGDRKSTRLNSSHIPLSRMPSSA